MPPLSSHEFSVLVLVRYGLTTKELASQLGVSIHTAKYHLTNIYRKLGAQNRVEASNAYDQLVERSSSARVRTILEWGTRLAASIASPIPRSRAAYVLIEDGMAIPIIAVATGIYPLPELERHSPDAGFTCCSDLLLS